MTPSTPAPDLYVDVIVPRRLHRPFTYLVPPPLRRDMAIGQRVVVPFGSATLHGIVVDLCSRPPAGLLLKRMKEVLSLAKTDQPEDISLSQLHLSRWLSERYLAPWGQCIKLLLPPMDTSSKQRTRYVLTAEGRQVATQSAILHPGERHILDRLSHRPSGLTWKTLQTSDAAASLQSRIALIRKGWIAERGTDKSDAHHPEAQQICQPGRRDEFSDGRVTPQASSGISRQEFLKQLQGALDRGSSSRIVLQASSDDRLSYLIDAVAEALCRTRRVLIVAGEVDRAEEIFETIRNRNHVPVVLFHSELSIRARAAAWQDAQSDVTDVVIGTRSSIFAPIRDIGLIWVEGEDNPALKEERVPRYHARDVARYRSALEKAALVLASNHPSLECVRSIEVNEATHITVPSRTTTPSIQVVDLRDFPRGTLLTPPMINGIRQAMASGELVTLYLNRKGYASLLLCRACGQVPHCPSCSLALTFHKRVLKLLCHSCGYGAVLPDVCIDCHAPQLEPVGTGTERIEESLRQCFPHVRIGRMDRDTIQRKLQKEALSTLIRAGEIDIVIGTQMLLPWGRIPASGFIGILNADAGLHLPDFRSTERTYHALQDAVALCRPGNRGNVIIQTYLPNHHAIAAVVKGTPLLFVKQELEFRRALDYPPFSHLIQLTISGKLENRVREVAEKWVSALGGAATAIGGPAISEPVTILGPTPAPISRSRQRHHWHVLAKSRSQEAVRQVVQETLSGMEQLSRRGDLKLTVDVDPSSML